LLIFAYCALLLCAVFDNYINSPHYSAI
jgi:hypothetical protein